MALVDVLFSPTRVKKSNSLDILLVDEDDEEVFLLSLPILLLLLLVAVLAVIVVVVVFIVPILLLLLLSLLIWLVSKRSWRWRLLVKSPKPRLALLLFFCMVEIVTHGGAEDVAGVRGDCEEDTTRSVMMKRMKDRM